MWFSGLFLSEITLVNINVKSAPAKKAGKFMDLKEIFTSCLPGTLCTFVYTFVISEKNDLENRMILTFFDLFGV